MAPDKRSLFVYGAEIAAAPPGLGGPAGTGGPRAQGPIWYVQRLLPAQLVACAGVIPLQAP